MEIMDRNQDRRNAEYQAYAERKVFSSVILCCVFWGFYIFNQTVDVVHIPGWVKAIFILISFLTAVKFVQVMSGNYEPKMKRRDRYRSRGDYFTENRYAYDSNSGGNNNNGSNSYYKFDNEPEETSWEYERAADQVKKEKAFYIHAAVYLLVNIFILFNNVVLDHEPLLNWENFYLPFFWGIGLAIQGCTVFFPDFLLGKDWEEKKIRELMKKDKEHQNYK